MRIAVGSGKGGTGKTTVSVGMALSLAEAGESVQLIDCDVEEPNAHIFLKTPALHEETVCLLVPEIDHTKCTFCGECSRFCAYNALAVFPQKVLVFNEMCHSCGGCMKICPEKAVTEKQRGIGVIRTGKIRGVRSAYGELNIGEAHATPLIRELKKLIDPDLINILDAPPGTACPFVETIKDSDFCILVTEPTPFGLHDLKIAVEVVKILGVPYGVIINRCDIGDSNVGDFCRQNEIPVLMSIKNDRNIAVAYSKGISIIDAAGHYKKEFIGVYRKVYERTRNNKR